MNFSRIILTSAASLLIAGAANAVPAYPGIVKYTQPDGSVVQLKGFGDEHSYTVESLDGFTLLQDNDGFWNYADLAGNRLVSSGVRYTPTSVAPVSTRHLRGVNPSSPKKLLDKSLQVTGSFPSKGKHKLLVLLLNFQDTEPTYTREDFDKMMNQENYMGIGSFRDYYLNQSYGQLDIECTVMPWTSSMYPKSSYNTDNAYLMIVEALKYLDDQIDYNDFDNDGDRVLDGIAVFHQGRGQESTFSSGDIWSHSSEIYGLELDGVRICRYTIQPELYDNNTMTAIGVMCHEFGHNLGSPDFYDTASNDPEFPGTGVWDIMGHGAWNGTYGERPASMNMWQKIQLEWVEPVTLDKTGDYTLLPSYNNPAAYRLNTTEDDDYFILENRQLKGPFDVALPGSGMLVYHANEKLIRSRVDANTLNSFAPQAMYTVCAAAGRDPGDTPNTYGGLETGAIPFPGTMGHHEFGDNTLPSTNSTSGRQSYVNLSNITNGDDEIVSFHFDMLERPGTPQNFKAEALKGIVTLSWEAPAGELPDYYSVYRNDHLIEETTATTFVDTDAPGNQLITYHVDATFTDGRVSPYAKATCRVPENKVSEIRHEVENDAVTLRWDVDNTLTRSPLNAETFDFSKLIFYNEVEYGHRYTADDLLTYKGCRFTNVKVFPALGPSSMEMYVRIWEKKANGSLSMITEQEVTEFGAGEWRDILLNKPVTIVNGREYYVTVRLVPKLGVVHVLTDANELIPGRGNWLRQGDEWSACEEANSNFYLSATIALSNLSAPVELPVFDYDPDPATDLYMPIGFRIYRDGEEIGTSGNRLFIDKTVTPGLHRYTVSTLYRSNLESIGLESDEFDINVSGIDFTITDPATNDVWFDLQGHRIAGPAKGQPAIRLSNGRPTKILTH